MAVVATSVVPAFYQNLTVSPPPLCNSWIATNRVQCVSAFVLRRTPYGLLPTQTAVYFHTPNSSRVAQMPVAAVQCRKSQVRQLHKGCYTPRPNLASTKKHLSNMPREATFLQRQAFVKEPCPPSVSSVSHYTAVKRHSYTRANNTVTKSQFSKGQCVAASRVVPESVVSKQSLIARQLFETQLCNNAQEKKVSAPECKRIIPDPIVEIYQQMDMILDYTLKVVFSEHDD